VDLYGCGGEYLCNYPNGYATSQGLRSSKDAHRLLAQLAAFMGGDAQVVKLSVINFPL
jgi:hypothetical protein